MKAVVIGSGSLNDKDLLLVRCSEADLIVAADGGACFLYDAGITPHILIGDFDSIPGEILRFFKEKGETRIVTFPSAKDFTDMELALEIAGTEGADEICILGAMGSRCDHTLANIFLLYNLLQRNIKGCIEDAHNRITLIQDTITIKKQENWKVSLLSVTPMVSKVTTKGLLYPLQAFDLRFGSSRGISNEFIDDTATISIEKGLLMVVISHEPD